ncbi:hypothetical protein E0H71_00350 [Rhizobium leguminosarum bv. viciae]|uniref:hypothetical protein n=1 Tax=Rhizobium leguminosarum TaxID=384 RepID=UPI0010397D48|nr:hypothetical protein [Rhizobium leguminosarum]TCA58087.1 hypothetical protein E0H71_00350 [Rhizobium leguminosarum bv. viciae]
MSTKDQFDNGRKTEIILTPPWTSVVDGQHRLYAKSVGPEPAGSNSDLEALFLQERTRLHESFIREKEKTRRLTIALSAGLIAQAALVPLFAPQGRETLSYLLAAALVVFAAGAVGFQTLQMKCREVDIKLSMEETNQSRNSAPSH